MDMGIVNAGNLPNYDDIESGLLRHIENLVWNRNTNATEELLRIGQQMESMIDDSEKSSQEEWRLLPPNERLEFSLIKVKKICQLMFSNQKVLKKTWMK